MQLVPQDLKKESVRVRIRIVFVVRDFCAFGSTPPGLPLQRGGADVYSFILSRIPTTRGAIPFTRSLLRLFDLPLNSRKRLV